MHTKNTNLWKSCKFNPVFTATALSCLVARKKGGVIRTAAKESVGNLELLQRPTTHWEAEYS